MSHRSYDSLTIFLGVASIEDTSSEMDGNWSLVSGWLVVAGASTTEPMLQFAETCSSCPA